MADSLKARVGRVIAGGVHALLDKLEDQAPEAMMEQAIREVDQVAGDVRHELGLVAANRHLAQQQHAHLNRQHESLSANVQEAIAQVREDLARTAVARQLDIEAQLPVLEVTLADLSRQESELKGYAGALLAKKREMEEALAQYRKSRAAAAVASGQTSTGTMQGRLDSAAGAFDRVYERQTGLDAGARSASLEQGAKLRELDELVRNNKIEERLAQLKAGRA
jgi:phage shock protein A